MRMIVSTWSQLEKVPTGALLVSRNGTAVRVVDKDLFVMILHNGQVSHVMSMDATSAREGVDISFGPLTLVWAVQL